MPLSTCILTADAGGDRRTPAAARRALRAAPEYPTPAGPQPELPPYDAGAASGKVRPFPEPTTEQVTWGTEFRRNLLGNSKTRLQKKSRSPASTREAYLQLKTVTPSNSFFLWGHLSFLERSA